MAKRYKDTLTGGTGDVNPQYVCVGGSQTSTNTAVTLPITIPVLPSFPGSHNKAQVIEVLKIGYDFGLQPQITSTQMAATSEIIIAFNANTAGLAVTAGAATLGNPLVLDMASFSLQAENTAAAGGGFSVAYEDQRWHDLTDGAGHGILVGVPQLWMGMNTTGWPVGGLLGAAVRIIYRFKIVDLTEYIGIVQQQSGPQI